jgi:hypothetical protein
MSLSGIVKRLEHGAPAAPQAVELFPKSCAMTVPDDYLQFLRFSNGAMGWLGEKQYLILWPVEKLLENNSSYAVVKCAPNLFLFGSNGGGEAYAFDASSSMSVVQVPFVPLDPAYAEYLAPTFSNFILSLAR